MHVRKDHDGRSVARAEDAPEAGFSDRATLPDEGPRGVPSATAAEAQLQATREQPGRYRGPRDPSGQHEPEPVELGRGGIGRVLMAYDGHIGREIAIKELMRKGAPLTEADSRASIATARFLREARLTGQLEHPNIVPVYELGQRADGTLYYTMKVVRGAHLGTALEKAKTLAERLKLLKHYADLCDAIAYAHSRGVIHRDIKPDNVMVGEFGETVVLDWGLAKPAGASDADAGPTPDRRSLSKLRGVRDVTTLSEEESTGAKTQDGALIGTPLYMSPEQAIGDQVAVDARTDVWALGVVLYELLTGEPPFSGRKPLEILVKIVKHPVPPVRTRCPEAPPELVAICEKALAREPADRYADARGLAEEIRAYLTGGRVRAFAYGPWLRFTRWARRHRAPLIVGAASVVALLTLGVVSYVKIGDERDLALTARVEAEAARDEAQSARARAEKAELDTRASRDDADRLVRFMVSDLKDRLEPLGQLSLLEGVAAEIGAYQQRADARATPRDLIAERNRAAVSDLVGDIHRARGDLARAETAYREAERLREALVSAHPDDPELRFDRAESHRRAGLLARVRGDLMGAKRQLDRAHALRVDLANAVPSAPRDVRALAESELDRGELATLMGDLKAAEAAYLAAVKAARSLLLVPPEDPESRHVLALALDALGVAYLDMDRAEARGVFSEALGLREALVASHPGNLAWLHRLAISHARLAEVEESQKDFGAADRAWREATGLLERLVSQDPGQARWVRDLAVHCNRLGDLASKAGRPEEALAHYEKALTHMASLAARDTANTEVARDVEVGHNRVGDALAALGRPADALARYRDGLAIAEHLAALDPANARFQHDLALTLLKVGGLERATAPGKEALERAVGVLAELVARDPSNAAWRVDLEAARGLADRTEPASTPPIQPQRPSMKAQASEPPDARSPEAPKQPQRPDPAKPPDRLP